MSAITGGSTPALASGDQIRGELPASGLEAVAERPSLTTAGDHPPALARTARRAVTRHPSPVTAPSDSSEESRCLHPHHHWPGGGWLRSPLLRQPRRCWPQPARPPPRP